MICPTCKKVYSDDNVFCISCGTRLIDDDSSKDKSTPIERFSNRVKTSKPQMEDNYLYKPNKQAKKITSTDQKLDVIISQNKKLIKQNKRIIELLEKLTV